MQAALMCFVALAEAELEDRRGHATGLNPQFHDGGRIGQHLCPYTHMLKLRAD